MDGLAGQNNWTPLPLVAHACFPHIAARQGRPRPRGYTGKWLPSLPLRRRLGLGSAQHCRGVAYQVFAPVEYVALVRNNCHLSPQEYARARARDTHPHGSTRHKERQKGEHKKREVPTYPTSSAEASLQGSMVQPLCCLCLSSCANVEVCWRLTDTPLTITTVLQDTRAPGRTQACARACALNGRYTCNPYRS